MRGFRYSLSQLRMGIHWIKNHLRLLSLCGVWTLLLACLFAPTILAPRNVYRLMFVFDITQSMNARDIREAGLPDDRLGYAKATVRRALHTLPCGSEVGLGLFTTQTVHFMFDPIEVCGHLSVIEDVLAHIDWRMAWSADTHVELGLYHALREVLRKDPSMRLLFLTDGQETPPLSMKPRYDGPIGEVKGTLIGVGGNQPVTVPRYDRDNNLLGPWENADIEKPPVSTTVYSEKVDVRTLPTEGPYLSWVDEAHLREVAATTGLGYAHPTNGQEFEKALTAPDLSEVRNALTDLRPFLGFAALIGLLLGFAIEGRPVKLSA